MLYSEQPFDESQEFLNPTGNPARSIGICRWRHNSEIRTKKINTLLSHEPSSAASNATDRARGFRFALHQSDRRNSAAQSADTPQANLEIGIGFEAQG